MIRCLVAMLAMGGILVSAGCEGYPVSTNADTEFTAQLTGDAARPDPVKTEATGEGTFSLNADETQLEYKITASGLSGDVEAAHFHFSAAGASGFGDVVFGITDTIMNDGAGGVTAEGTWNLTASDVTNLRIRYIYVNLHTELNPGGEIRGNLVPVN